MMMLVIGGASCGKSAYAEEAARKGPVPRYYLAAMRPYGEEGLRRVERHRALRAGKGFETIERYTDLASLTLPPPDTDGSGIKEKRGTVLLECVGNLTANEMFDEEGNMSDPADRVVRGIAHLREQCRLLVVVTNNVGSDGVEYAESTRAYISSLGKINAALAAAADTVVEVVAGIPVLLKGELPV